MVTNCEEQTQIQPHDDKNEAELTKVENKPLEVCFRVPITLKPHPVSARLYLPIEDWDIEGRQPITPDETCNLVMQKMETDDLKESIIQNGILVPLVINSDGSIISGSRRWKVAMELGLARVPVEVRAFSDDCDEEQAIIDYNLSRVKTFSQKMKEAELIKEIAAKRAKIRKMSGRRDLTAISGEGPQRRHDRETATIVGSHISMGNDKFRKAEYVYNKAKDGNRKALEMIAALDKGETTVNAAHRAVKSAEVDSNEPQLSRWERNEAVDDGDECICHVCGEHCWLQHLKNGEHRTINTGPEETKLYGTTR
jgi:ParB-like chromosome segregation protein Spo0J